MITSIVNNCKVFALIFQGNPIETLIGENGVRSSGGEKQRIALAQAILSNKKIILLDETSVNLDVDTEKRIINRIINVIKENNMTILAISHRIDFFRKSR